MGTIKIEEHKYAVLTVLPCMARNGFQPEQLDHLSGADCIFNIIWVEKFNIFFIYIKTSMEVLL